MFLFIIFLPTAKKNLELRPKLDEMKETLKLKYQELESLKSNVDQKLEIQTEKTESRSLPHLQVIMRR